MVSFERLSLVIEYNQIGSLSSLGRLLNKVDSDMIKNRGMRRVSDSYGMFNSRSSASKVDLLRSAIEVNSRNYKLSIGHLNRHNSSGSRIVEVRTSSAPKLTQGQKSSITSISGLQEIQKLIPDETDEIKYDLVKKKQAAEMEETKEGQK